MATTLTISQLAIANGACSLKVWVSVLHVRRLPHGSEAAPPAAAAPQRASRQPHNRKQLTSGALMQSDIRWQSNLAVRVAISKPTSSRAFGQLKGALCLQDTSGEREGHGGDQAMRVLACQQPEEFIGARLYSLI